MKDSWRCPKRAGFPHLFLRYRAMFNGWIRKCRHCGQEAFFWRNVVAGRFVAGNKKACNKN